MESGESEVWAQGVPGSALPAIPHRKAQTGKFYQASRRGGTGWRRAR